MPAKKKQETEAEQAARFEAEVAKLVAAGELSPIDAETALDELVRKGFPQSK